MSSNGDSQHQTPALTGPVDERGSERRKSEQEIIAIAIYSVAQPEHDWEKLDPEIKQRYMKMAAASVRAAMPPLPEHQGSAEPPYPADLLDMLAVALAEKLLAPMELREGARRALDHYEREVGRENVPATVAKAIAEL